MPGLRNPALIDNLRSDFQHRKEPNFVWGNIVSMYTLFPQLRGLWTFSSVDENGLIYDYSGQGRHLTNNNSAPFSTSGLLPIMNFTPASSHYLSRLDEAGLDITTVLTLGGWFKFDAADVEYGLISKWGAAGLRAYRLYKSAGNNIVFEISTDGTAVTTVVSSVSVVIDTWYYCAGIFNPSTEIAVFVNNVKTNNVTAIPATIFNAGTNFEIGRTVASSYLDGSTALCYIGASA